MTETGHLEIKPVERKKTITHPQFHSLPFFVASGPYLSLCWPWGRRQEHRDKVSGLKRIRKTFWRRLELSIEVGVGDRYTKKACVLGSAGISGKREWH